MKQKKGIELNQAFGAVLTLVLVAVLVIIAIVIFVSLATSFAGTTSVTVTNESSAWLNITPYTVVGASDCEFADFSVTGMWNTTDAAVIPVANYTVGATGTVVNATTGTWATIDTNISYTYTWGSDACTASESMTSEFGNYTSLVGLVGTIIFLGLVIGVLIASFAFGRRRV